MNRRFPSKQHNKTKSLLQNNVFGIVIAVSIIAVIFTFQDKKVPNSTLPVMQHAVQAETRNLPVQPFTQGIDKIYTSAPLEAPFTLHTAQQNIYLKLLDKHTKQIIMTIKVPSHQTIQVKVPLGEFIIRVAAGDEWYGDELLFGTTTRYKEFEHLFNFYRSIETLSSNTTRTRIMGHQIYFQENIEGNLHSRSINSADF